MNEKKSVRKETTNRSKTLHIAKIFRKYSDESHPLKQQDVLDYLEKDYHYMPNRKTVSSAIEDLEEYGEMTFGRTKNEGIYLKGRPFGERDALFLMAMVHEERNLMPEEKKKIVNSILSGFSDSQQEVLKSYLEKTVSLDLTGLNYDTYKLLNQCANSKAEGGSLYRRYVYIRKRGERMGNFYHPLPGPLPSFEGKNHSKVPVLVLEDIHGKKVTIPLSSIETIQTADPEEFAQRDLEERTPISPMDKNGFGFITTSVRRQADVEEDNAPLYLFIDKEDGLPYYSTSPDRLDKEEIKSSLLKIVDLLEEYPSKIRDNFRDILETITHWMWDMLHSQDSLEAWILKEEKTVPHVLVFLSGLLRRGYYEDKNNPVDRLLLLEIMEMVLGGIDYVLFAHLKRLILTEGKAPSFCSLFLPRIDQDNASLYPITKEEYRRLVDIAIETNNIDLSMMLLEAYAAAPYGPDDSYEDFKRLLDHVRGHLSEMVYYSYRRCSNTLDEILRRILRRCHYPETDLRGEKVYEALCLLMEDGSGRPSPFRPIPVPFLPSRKR